MHERDKGYIQPDNEPDHKDARISALTAEVERITNDRDAWREQHDNLVACFQTEQKNLGAKIDTLELQLTVSEKGRICAIEDKQGFIEDWKRLTAENERLRGALREILQLFNPSQGRGTGRTREQVANDYFRHTEETVKIASAAIDAAREGGRG